MKRLLTVAAAALLAWPGSVRAEGPDDKYIEIYKLIQEGDQLSASGQNDAARQRFSDARVELKKLQTNYPTWNEKLVEFRLRTIEEKLIPAQKPVTPGAVPAPGTNSTPPTASSQPRQMKAPTPAPEPAALPAASAAPAFAPAAPAAAPAPAPAKAEADQRDEQIRALQEQVGRLQNDRGVLEAKLREALAAQPAALDPRELTKAEQRIKTLEKEKEILRVSVLAAEARAAAKNESGSAELKKSLDESKRKLAEQNNVIIALRQEKEVLQQRLQTTARPEDDAAKALHAENEALKQQLAEKASAPQPAAGRDQSDKELATTKAALQSSRDAVASLQVRMRTLQEDRDRLDKTRKDLETKLAAAPSPANDAAQLRRVQKERDDLQKKLNDVTQQLADHKGKGKNRSPQGGEDVSGLRARLEVLEANKVPYTPEELALFKQPQEPIVLAKVEAAPPVGTKELPESAAPLLAEAQRAMNAHRFDEAEKKYAEVLRIDEKNVRTLQRLAAAQLEQNRPKDAEATLKSALAQNPSDPRTLLLIGIAKFDQNKFDEALTHFSRSAQLDPQNPKTQNYLGITLSQKGQRAAAETALRKAVQLSPNYKEAHYNLAVIYATQQPPFTELARWHYQKALAFGHPQNADLEKLLDRKQSASQK